MIPVLVPFADIISICLTFFYRSTVQVAALLNIAIAIFVSTESSLLASAAAFVVKVAANHGAAFAVAEPRAALILALGLTIIVVAAPKGFLGGATLFVDPFAIGIMATAAVGIILAGSVLSNTAFTAIPITLTIAVFFNGVATV